MPFTVKFIKNPRSEPVVSVKNTGIIAETFLKINYPEINPDDIYRDKFSQIVVSINIENTIAEKSGRFDYTNNIEVVIIENLNKFTIPYFKCNDLLSCKIDEDKLIQSWENAMFPVIW